MYSFVQFNSLFWLEKKMKIDPRSARGYATDQKMENALYIYELFCVFALLAFKTVWIKVKKEVDKVAKKLTL